MHFRKNAPGSRESEKFSRLLKTKLAPPLPGPGCIPRSHLDEWMREAASSKLILVNAPAGFGKTTVMLQWLARVRDSGRGTAWLTLDPGDNDAVRFVSYLWAALIGIDPNRRLEEGKPSEITSRPTSAEGLMNIIDWISSREIGFVLFMDDFENIYNGEIYDLVREFLDCLLPDQQVVLASREIPKLPIARMNARRQLTKIGLEELRFAREETEQFLRQGAGATLKREEVTRLHEHSEGWAAGIQLAALALTGREDRAEFIQSFSGSFRDIADYLAEDVLARQPDDVRDFLLRTSILERLSGPLCDALTGRSDGYETLAYIEKANLFVSPLDDERHWYRYHNLFAQFLRERLERGFRDRVAALHVAASTWFEERGRLPEAVRHALAAGDMNRAGALMARCARALVRIGQVRTVADWCERLPRDVLEKTPELRLDYCWSLAFRNRFEEARAVLTKIRKEGEPALAPRIADEILALQGVLLVFEDRVDEAQEIARKNIEEVSDRTTFAYGTLADTMGFCLISASQFSEAERMLERVYVDQSKAIGGGIVTVYSECLRGLSRMIQGRLKEALSLYREGYSRVVREFPQNSVLRAVSAAFLAEALYEVDELDEAEKVLSNGLPVIREHRPLEPIIFSYRILSRIQLCRGRDEEATRLLDEGEELGREAGACRLAATLHLERIRFAIQRGDLESAEQLTAEASSDLWKGYGSRKMPASDPETPEVIGLRLMIRKGRADRGLKEVRSALERAEASRRMREALSLRILEAEALDAHGERRAALRAMRKALEAGSREGFVRAFADGGEPVIQLIRVVRDTLPEEEVAEGYAIPSGFLDHILAASGCTALRRAREAEWIASEELTKREIEVLEHCGLGLSNQEIADRLFLSVGTVKFHLGHINMKLGAKNRTEALLKARQRGLIS